MKKILSLLMALCMVFSFTACSEADEVLSDLSHLATELSELADELDAELASEETAPSAEVSFTTEAPSQEALESSPLLDEYGTYSSKDDVALFLHLYGRLPDNFMTKSEAKSLGWEGGSLEDYAPGMCIGGDRFGNYEELLPTDRTYRECDIDTLGTSSRGAKRLVFSDDGLIYYTEDHYESFELLYGEP